MSLYVMGVSPDTLFCHKCDCDELNVHGFWHQLEKVKDEPRKRVTVTFYCDKCSKVTYRRYRLTTSKVVNHRLVNWFSLFARFGHRLPSKWWPRWAKTAMWLERRFPV